VKVFFPLRSEDVEASPPHPEDTQYRVAYGHEHWGEDPCPVWKVQMVYAGQVSGRKAPSYPVGTDDFERVLDAMRRVMAGGGGPRRGAIDPS
jgi:hypothetical protein